MKTINKIIILLITLLFLTACGGTTQKTLQYNFKQGHGNLVISTPEGWPPDIIYPETTYGIIVDLKNEGAYDLTNGRVKILGFDEKYITLEENEKEIISRDTEESVLKGKSSLSPDGDDASLSFPFQTKLLFPGAETYTAYYYIKADYDYKTELMETVCINPKTYEVYDSGCKVEPKTSLKGQGSPLAITTLEEIIHPGNIPQVEFRFTLKNKGKGRIKLARLELAKLANMPLNCEFKNNPSQDRRTFDFKDKKEAVLICKRNLDNQMSYETTLFIDLSFSYSLQEKKKITLKE